MPEPEPFKLSPPPSHLMDLDTAARSFGVSRQAFHRWNVRPVRIEGTRRLFDFASVIENRLQIAGDADRTPDDAERDRLQARVDLLTEQLEAQHIKNHKARSEYARHEHANGALRSTVEAVAKVIETIPPSILEANAKTHPARDAITSGVNEAIDALRAAVIEPGESESGSEQVYT